MVAPLIPESPRAGATRRSAMGLILGAPLVAGHRTVTARAPERTIPLFLRAGAVVPMLPTSVDTLSDYGDDVVHLGDRADRRTLLAVPVAGSTRGTLGVGESLTSQVTRRSWSLQVDATVPRTYDVQAALTGLDRSWRPCRVEADGQQVDFTYDRADRVLRFSADLAAAGRVSVVACR